MTVKTFKEAYKQLSEPFDLSAYSIDSSRGFDLSSLKAQYMVERLNEVMGIEGWKLTGTHQVVDKGILFLGTLTLTLGDKSISQEGIGFSSNGKNTGDAYKGSITDCLSKTASWFGVANEAFKGNVSPEDIRKATGKTKPTKVKSSSKTSTSSKSTGGFGRTSSKSKTVATSSVNTTNSGSGKRVW